ncbi:hypothetical protein P7K49_025068 [Saguinus oedipus]|uniref:Uncharacterized protein n=1 Tax=Saguinus oedipus TaxID=9490 RepID=A0ABQ9UG15_SAGOE|nr:hypothetical protein P7K49_025068 [Saguinus oedipus]
MHHESQAGGYSSSGSAPSNVTRLKCGGQHCPSEEMPLCFPQHDTASSSHPQHSYLCCPGMLAVPKALHPCHHQLWPRTTIKERALGCSCPDIPNSNAKCKVCGLKG